MTSLEEVYNNQLPSEDFYWEQLDYLHELHLLERNQEKLMNKLKTLKRNVKQHVKEQHAVQLKAIRHLIKELMERKDEILSYLEPEYKFFQLEKRKNLILIQIRELNRTVKRDEMPYEEYMDLLNSYNIRLEETGKSLEKLRTLAREYILILRDKEIKLRAKEKIIRSKKLRDRFSVKKDNTACQDYIKNRQEIKKKIAFLRNWILI